MSAQRPRASEAIRFMLDRRWRAWGRCSAVLPDQDARKPPLQCVEAPGHAGEHQCPMQVRW